MAANKHPDDYSRIIFDYVKESECPECGNLIDECICAAIIDEYLDENN